MHDWWPAWFRRVWNAALRRYTLGEKKKKARVSRTVRITIINMETSWETPGPGKNHLSAFIWRLEAPRLWPTSVCVFFFRRRTCQRHVRPVRGRSDILAAHRRLHAWRSANGSLLVLELPRCTPSTQRPRRKAWDKSAFEELQHPVQNESTATLSIAQCLCIASIAII